MIKIENWSVTSADTPYTPPEACSFSLQGEVYDHPHFSDGDRVCTSTIVNVDGPIVMTYSGSVYRLGTPEPNYVEWCRKQGRHIPTSECHILVHVSPNQQG